MPLMLVGMDEVGRGCWAGPLCVAAVGLHTEISGLKDSKLLTSLQRNHLAEQIRQHSSVGIGWVSAVEIDRIGLSGALSLAMQLAAEEVVGIEPRIEKIIIDGRVNYLPRSAVPVETMVKADQLVGAVSAASIIAKVARDNFMRNMKNRFPQFGFDVHVGYGTSRHITELQQHGPTVLHRMSYKPLQALQLQRKTSA